MSPETHLGLDAGPDTDTRPAADTEVFEDLSDSGQADTGPDALAICIEDCAYDGPHAAWVDCDYDRLTNAEELSLGSDPCSFDSDEDGLGDFEEFWMGTNLLDADTDEDGLEDERELDFGFHPRLADSFDDGMQDGDRWIVQACDTFGTEQIDTFQNHGGDWLVALRPGFEYTHLEVADLSQGHPPTGAARFENVGRDVVGFVFSHPAADLCARLGEFAEMDDLSGATRVSRVSEPSIETALKYDAHRSEEIWVTDTEMTTLEFRSRYFDELAPFAMGQVTGMEQGATTSVSDTFVVHTIAVMTPRGNFAEDTVLVTSVVTPIQSYIRSNTQLTMRYSTNGTNIARQGDLTQRRCETHRVTQLEPNVDVIWVVDRRASLEQELDRLRAELPQIASSLEEQGVDWRMAVVPADQDPGELKWRRSSAAVESDMQALPQSTGQAFEAASAAAQMAKFGVDRELLARPNAQLVLVWVVDREQESWRDSDGGPYLSPYERLSQGLNYSDATTFAIIGKSLPCGSVREDYNVFQSLTRETRCTGQDIWPTDLKREFLSAAAKVPSTNGVVRSVPISSTMRVFRNGEFVPPSVDRGVEYDHLERRLTFSQEFEPRPPNVDEGFYGDAYALSFERMRNNHLNQPEGVCED